MAWQRRHRGLDAIVTVACFLATISLCSGGIPYNVTIASVTLFHKYSWFTAPAVYLSCGDGSGGNRTELPGVNATMRWFNFTGNESWQPVAKLHREECTECGLYEHEWLGDAIYDTWTVCAANFSSRDERGIFTHVVPSRFHVNLACYECNHAQFQRSSAYGHSAAEGGAGSMSVFLWMGLAVAGAGLMILLIAAIVYLVTEADELLDESEKTRFIEMAEDGHGDGHGDGELAKANPNSSLPPSLPSLPSNFPAAPLPTPSLPFQHFFPSLSFPPPPLVHHTPPSFPPPSMRCRQNCSPCPPAANATDP
ncbi:unnamed protein product [Closterium sp. Naga37s-1]|nr:unnamed protein product [Closterium sp. Naga37s-1]